MTEFARFGDPARFEVAVRWTRDAEARARRPARHGWSMGDLALTVGGAIVTRSRRGAATQSHVGWYLAPFFEWLASNWAPLLHEEAFAWPEKSDTVAVIACNRALDRWIATTDVDGRTRYRDIQAWYRRHAVRQAAEGGLFPDLFVRRLADDIELSWSTAPPFCAPHGFQFVVEPGHARLAVAEVGGPLWEALQWTASQPPPTLHESDRAEWRALCEKVEAIPNLTDFQLDSAFVAPEILVEVRKALDRAGKPELAVEAVERTHPFVETFSPAVAMFGGVSPGLTSADVDALCRRLVKADGGEDSESLKKLISEGGAPIGVPYEEGYGLAEGFLADLNLPGFSNWVDIRDVAGRLGIEVDEISLDTGAIRGVAFAGEGFQSTILVNQRSVFNANENGKRFTIAHELCHILIDRSRARRVAHISGHWVAPGVERRANAFAAYVLMPRELVLRHFSGHGREPEAIIELAAALRVNETALIEHLYNIDLIDEVRREELRDHFRRH